LDANSEISNKTGYYMTQTLLSEIQINELAVVIESIISDDTQGIDITELCYSMFEDISGFENATEIETEELINVIKQRIQK